MARSTRDDILPTQIVKDFTNECANYEKYRFYFKPTYKHILSCVGLEEKDWTLSRPRATLRCNNLYQQLITIHTMMGQEEFIAEIRPVFEAAIAVENDFYGQLKTALQVIYDFFTNEFETKKAEFAELGSELESLQNNRPTDPELIQHMDKVMSRFTELRCSLKSIIQPKLATLETQHLKAIRDATELYVKQNEQWVRSFAPFAKFKTDLTIKVREPKEPENEESEGNKKKKDLEKSSKLGEDDKDM